LFLAFSVQRKIAEGLVGKQFWESQSRKRSKMTDGELGVISKLREEIVSGRLTVDDDGFEEDEEDDVPEERSNPRTVGKEKDPAKGAKALKVVPVNDKPGPTKLVVTAGGGVGAGVGVGGVGVRRAGPGSGLGAAVTGTRTRASFDGPTTTSSTSVTDGSSPNNEEDKAKGQGFYRNRAQSLESSPADGKLTYLTEVRGVKSDSSMKALLKKVDEKDTDGKRKKKPKLVESERMDKGSLKAALKAQMPIEEDDDKTADVTTGAAVLGLALTSQSERQDKGGLMALFGRVEKRKKKGKVKDKVAEVLPPSILKSEEKKRQPSEKRVVFDLPDNADEDDYAYDELGEEE
jgi:hypothetical protein